MSSKERIRKVIFEDVKTKRLTLKQASERLKISYRQCRRSYKRYTELSDEGLIHASRGGTSNHQKSPLFKQEVLNYYRSNLTGFGPTLAAEKLLKAGYPLDHETLRLWLLSEGLWVKCRRRKGYRSYRARRARFGELVQMDGSHHVWFGEEKSCLMNMVDDATSKTHARLFEEETTEAAMRTLWSWITRYGIPLSLYTDRKNVYVTEREATLEEQLAGEEPLTAFGKACQKLGIEIVKAYSPQAKGRVERSHGVYQDRFVKELKLQNKTNIAEANAVLKNIFCEELNDRFSCLPAEVEDAHRPVPVDIDLADIFCFEDVRVVKNDWTILYNNQWYQLSKNGYKARPKTKVTIRTRLDGTQTILFCGEKLDFKPIEKSQRLKKEVIIKPCKPVYRPPREHLLKKISYERRLQKEALKKALAAGQGLQSKTLQSLSQA
jgi:hypothetical protein